MAAFGVDISYPGIAAACIRQCGLVGILDLFFYVRDGVGKQAHAGRWGVVVNISLTLGECVNAFAELMQVPGMLVALGGVIGVLTANSIYDAVVKIFKSVK